MPVSAEKAAYSERFNKLLDTYSKVLFVTVDHVQSQQVHQIRQSLRGKAELLMGKNTLQRRIVINRANDSESAQDKLLEDKFVTEGLLRGNRGLLFTNGEVSEIEEVFRKFRIQAPAKIGTVAPCDVVIPAGNTGMEPTLTSFFQALNIPTKISKGTVEILTDKKVLSLGDKVDNSTAALLQKLKISPFWYAMEVDCMWDRGVVFSKADLGVTDDSLKAALLGGISNITAISLAAGVPTEASFPVLLLDAFANLLALSVETDYEFTEFNGKQLRSDIKSGKVSAAAAAPAAAAAAAPAAAKKEEKKKAPEPEPEEDDDFGMGGLF